MEMYQDINCATLNRFVINDLKYNSKILKYNYFYPLFTSPTLYISLKPKK